MNKIFKVIWNQATQSWVAVSELEKAKGKTSSKIDKRVAITALAAVGVLSFSGAYAAVSIGSTSGNTINATGATASGDDIAIGNGAVAGNQPGAVVIGQNASGQTAGPTSNHANYNNKYNPLTNTTTAPVQKDGQAIVSSVVVVGRNANAQGGGVAIGDGAQSIRNNGALGVAIGANAVGKAGGIAIGSSTSAQGRNSFALGRQAAAVGDASQAIGSASAAVGNGATAIGHSSQALGNRSIAFGSSTSNAAFDEATATIVEADNSIGIGSNARVGQNAANSIAIGTKAENTGKKGGVIGYGLNDKGEFVRTGDETGEGQIAIGYGAKTTAGLIGTKQAGGEHAIAIGTGAFTEQMQDVAVGAGAKITRVKNANGELVGSENVLKNGSGRPASVAFGAQTSSGGTHGDTVIGAGASSSNNTQYAISQATALGSRATVYGDQALAIGADTKAIGDSSVAIGGDDLDKAINELSKVDTEIKGVGSLESIKALMTNAEARSLINNPNNEGKMYPNTSSVGGASVAVGVASQALGIASVAEGANALAYGQGSIALGLLSRSGLSDEARNQIQTVQNKVGKLNASLDTVRAFVRSTAINSHALFSALRDNIVAELGKVDDLVAIFGEGATAETVADQLMASATNPNWNDARNEVYAWIDRAKAKGDELVVKVGEGLVSNITSDTIAIGTRAHASGKEAIAMGRENTASGTQSIAMGEGNQVSGNQSIAVGVGGQVSGNYSGAFGYKNTFDTANTFVLGNNVTKTLDNSVFLGNKAAYVEDGATTKGNTAYPSATDVIVDKTLSFAGKVAGVVSVGDVGAERRIQNVSPGLISATSTDAINGSQLYAVADELNKKNYFHVNPAGDPSTAGNTTNLDYVDGIGGATGGEALAAGVNAIASGRSAVAMGKGAKADSLANIAIGEGAQALTEDKNTGGLDGLKNDSGKGINKAIAIGSGSRATNAKTIAIGDQANASGRNASAIGSAASVSGAESTGIGVAASVTGDYATGIGQRVRAQGQQSTAVGTWALTSGDRSTALGRSSAAAGNRAVSVGSEASAVADFSVSAGAYSRATDESAIALGRGANANSVNSAALGRSATAIGRSAVAIGENALAGSQEVKAAYNDAYSKEEKKVYDEGVAKLLASKPTATEQEQRSAGTNEVEVRKLEVVNAAKAAAKLAADNLIAAGGTKTGENTVAIGKEAVAEYKDNVVLGAGSRETSATVANPASLGTINTAEVNGITYSGFAATSPTSVVSIGKQRAERRLINVAAGKISSDSTDAINGSQLYMTNQALGNLAKSTATHLGGGATVNPDGSIKAPTYTVNSLGNVAPALTANNVGDALTNLNSYINKGFNVQDNTGAVKGTVTPTEAIKFTNGTGTTATVSDEAEHVTAITFNVNKGGLTINDTGKVTSTTSGDNFVTGDDVADAINNSGFKLTATNTAGGEVEGTKDQLIKSGETVTIDAGKNIKLKQENGKITVATKDDVTFDDVTATTVTTGGTTLNKDGLNVGGVTVNSTPITVNGTQVNNVNDAINQTAAQAFKALSFGGDSGTDVTRKLGEKVNVKGGVTESAKLSSGNIGVVANGTDTLDIKLAKDLKDIDSITINGGPTIDGNGINMNSDKITNVANGTDPNDAVNVSQLNAAKSKVEAGKNVTVDTKADPNGNGTVYTVNAKDTTASVAANSTDYVTVTKGDTNTDNVTDYAIGLTDTAIADFKKDTNTHTGVKAADGGAVAVNKLGTAANGDERTYEVDLTTETKQKIDNALSSFTTSVNGTQAETINKDNNDVNFVNGTGTIARVTDDKHITFDVNTTTIAVDNKTGAVTVPTTENNQIATAKTVADAISKAGFTVKANDETDGDLINPGETVTFKQGSNIEITRAGSEFTVKTAENVTFTDVTTNNLTVNKGGAVNMGNNVVTNIANGTNPNDAVNVSQLNAAKTVVEGTNGVTVTPEPIGENGKDGTKYIVKANTDDTTVKVEGDKITAVTTDITQGTDGKATATTGTSLVTGGQVADAINKAGLKFKGDVASADDGSNTFTRNNQEETSIIGGQADRTKLSDENNIGVVSNSQNELKIKLAKDIKVDSVTANNNVTIGDTVITPTTGKGLNFATGGNDSVLTGVTSGLTTPTNGLVNLDNNTVANNTAATVGDLRNMGWVVSSNKTTTGTEGQSNTDAFSKQVKNAGEVKFVGTGAAKVSGTTQGDANVITVHVDPAEAPETAKISTNTITGKAGTGTDGSETPPNSTALVTAGDVIEAVNNSFWKVFEGSTNAAAGKKDDVKAGDNVVFANGTATTANVTSDGTTTTVKYNAEVDGTTIKIEGDKIAANTGDLANNENTGKVNTPDTEAEGKKLTTVADVADAINNAGFRVKSAGTNKADDDQAEEYLVKTGELVEFEAGDNLTVKREGGKFTYATKDKVTFTDVTTKNLIVQEGGTVDMGNNAVTNVAGNLDGAKKDTTAPTTNASKPTTLNNNNAATVGDVLNAGWNLQGNGSAVDFVKAYDTVNFVNGKGTKAVVETNGEASSIKVDIDNGTITTNDDGSVTGPVTDELKKALEDAKNALNADPDNQDLKDAVAKAEQDLANATNQVATAQNVADAVNKSGFNLKTSATEGENKTADDLKTKGELINPSDTVEMIAGKNLTVKQEANGKVTFATKNEVEFDSIKVPTGTGTTDKPITINKDGIDMANKPITNINNGLTTYNDATKPTNGLVNLDNNAVENNTAATVGDLRNMGWVVSSDKTTDNLGTTYNEQVKNANEVKFVGKGLATVSGKTEGDVRTITVDVNAQNLVETAQLPVVYTNANGDKLTKIDDKFYKVDDVENGQPKTGVAEVKPADVIASMNSGDNNTKTPTTLANVKSNLEEVSPANEKQPDANSIANLKDKKNNAATVADVLNAGWNLQNNDTAVDTVTHNDSVNFVNGRGTTVSVTANDDGTVNNVQVDSALGYVNTDKNDTSTPSNTVKLFGEGNEPVQMTNVASGVRNEDGTAPTGPALADAINNAEGDTLNNAVNVGDLQAVSKAAKTEVESVDNSVNIEERQGDNGQTIYDLSVNQSDLKASDDKKTVSATKAGNAFATAEDVANAINTASAAATTEVTSENGSITVTESRGDNGQNIYDLEVTKATLSYDNDGKVVSNKDGDAFATGKNVADMINTATAAAKTEVTGTGLAVVTAKNGDNGQTIYNVDVAKADAPTVARGSVTVKAGDENKVMTAGDIATAITNSEKTSSVKAGSDAVTVKTGDEDANGNTEYTVDLSDEMKAKINKEESVSAGDNITVAENGTNGTGGKDYKVSLNKNLDLTDTGSVKMGDTTVNKDGITINNNNPDKTVSLTNEGLNNGGNSITNVKSNLADVTPANEKQPDANSIANLEDKKNNAATVADVLNAGWNLQNNDTAVDTVTHNDTVNFVDGRATTVSVTANDDGTVNDIKVDVETDDKSITVKDGKLTTVTSEIAANPNGSVSTQLQEELKKAQDELAALPANATPEQKQAAQDKVDAAQNAVNNANNALATAQNVADAINKSGWNLAAKGTGGSELINPSDTVTFKAGSDNLTVARDGAEISYDLAKDIKVDSVQFGDDGPKITNEDGNINVADKDGNATSISNVKSNLADVDPINDKQPDANSIANLKDKKNNAATVADVLNAGWNLQNNDTAVDTVTHNDTVNFVNGRGTTVSVTANDDGTVNNVQVDSALGYVNADENDTSTPSSTVKLFSKDKEPVQVTNVASGVRKPDGSTLTGKELADAIKNATADNLTNAVNIGDLQAAVNSVATKVVGDQGVSVTPTANPDGSTTYTVAAKTDGTTIKVENGNITANTAELTEGDKQGSSKANAGDENKLITAGGVASAINKSGWNLAAEGTNGEELINPSDKVTFKTGSNNLTVKRDGSNITYDLARNIDVDSLKAGDTTVNNDGITINNGAAGNPVSLTKGGLNNGGNRITNVAAGRDDTDAVNVSQLKGAVNYLDNKINNNNRDLRAGIAGSNAAAGLPQVYLPGKSMVAASAGTFKGEAALAVGYSRASDNGKLILKLQGNTNTRGDIGGSIGMGYQW